MLLGVCCDVIVVELYKFIFKDKKYKSQTINIFIKIFDHTK